MRAKMTISPLGLKLIKAYEGYREQPKQLVTGQYVIGYGHVLKEGETYKAIDQVRADEILRQDLKPIEALIGESIYAPLSQNQFDALCSLAFNIGAEAFSGSNVRACLNNGRPIDAANGFDEWRKANIAGRSYIVDALIRRRTSEKALFLRGQSIVAAADRNSVPVQSDESFVSISDQANLYDPQTVVDSGLVQQIPFDAKPLPQRRAEDTPIGFFGLSEIKDQNESAAAAIDADGLRTVFDPETIQGRDLEAPAKEQEPLILDNLIDDALIDDMQIDVDGLDVLDFPEQRDKILRPDEADKMPSFDFDIDQDLALDSAPKIDDLDQNVESPIALAAAEVSERLDALIDKSRLSETISQNYGQSKTLASAELEPGDDPTVVDFPSNDRDGVKRDNQDISNAETGAALKPKRAHDSASSYIITDEAVDSKELLPENQNQSRSDKSMGIYALLMVIGGCMLAAGLVTWTGSRTILTDLGSLLVPMGILIGGLMILGSLYYMIRHSLRHA